MERESARGLPSARALDCSAEMQVYLGYDISGSLWWYQMSVRKVLKSPLVHFFALGGMIFAAFAVINDHPAPQRPDTITLTPQDAARLAQQFTAAWNRAPTPDELDGLMRSWVLEEANVREALAIGLDRGDAVIRQRLNLKMEFLAESSAAALEADDQTLQAYLDANPGSFLRPARLAFDQVLLPAEDRSEKVAAIRAALQAGADPLTMGGASLLPTSVPMTPVTVINGVFGTDFHVLLANLPLGSWQGLVRSAYGEHLVRVTARADTTLPPLSEIRDRVEAEWRAAQAKAMRDASAQALLSRYTVTLPDAAEVLGE